MLHDRSSQLTVLHARLAGYAVELAAIRLQLLLRKANFNPGQPRDEVGRWITEGVDGLVHDVSRRRGGRREGTPAQEARLAAAIVQARSAQRRLRDLDPDWRGPQSVTLPESVEGRIAHQEATARAAEARLADILRDAIPSTNPSWGVNRLRRELYDRGFVLRRPTDSPGLLYRNESTGEEVRIMERPQLQHRSDPREKYTFRYYYRYRPGRGQREGAHTPIPDKD